MIETIKKLLRESDNFNHFIYSILIVVLVALLASLLKIDALNSVILGASSTLCLLVGKEFLHDYFKQPNYYALEHVYAGFLGVLTSSILLLLLSFI